MNFLGGWRCGDQIGSIECKPSLFYTWWVIDTDLKQILHRQNGILESKFVIESDLHIFLVENGEDSTKNHVLTPPPKIRHFLKGRNSSGC